MKEIRHFRTPFFKDFKNALPANHIISFIERPFFDKTFFSFLFLKKLLTCKNNKQTTKYLDKNLKIN